MSDYIIYYMLSNIVCLIIFGILLFHDILNKNHQERQIKYDYALVAFMAYFFSDMFWAMIIDGLIPKNIYTVVIANIANYVCMASITYFWLEYAKAVLGIPKRNKKLSRLIFALPSLAAFAVLIVLSVFAPGLLFDENFNPKLIYEVFLVAVPSINIVAALVYSLKTARHEVNPIDRRKHLSVGLFPLFVIGGGLLQVIVLPNTPIFCFACTILMLNFHIQLMQTAISLDSLTGLNNRGQLIQFISQHGEGHQDLDNVFVIMLDINGFKSINDTFGHAEGDRALILVAKALKAMTKEKNMTMFLGRYGGDEFVMIVKADDGSHVVALIEELRRKIVAECENQDTPYTLSIGAGYDRISDEDDSYRSCILRADKNLYLDKASAKSSGQTTVINRR